MPDETEWSGEDNAYLGRCPDVITGIHGSDPIRLYEELCEVVDDVLASFQASRARNRPWRVSGASFGRLANLSSFNASPG